MKENDVIRALAALGQPIRLRVFRALVVAGEKGLTPGTMSETLGLPAARLVTQERASRNLIYRAEYDQMNALLAYMTENCCQGESCLESPVVSCNCARRERDEAIAVKPASSCC